MGKWRLSAEAFKRHAQEYIKECADKNRVPLISEWVQRLGLTKRQFKDFEDRYSYKEAIERVKEAQEVGLSRKLLDENKPVGSIFLLKSLHNYDDRAGINVNINGDLGVVQLPAKTAKLDKFVTTEAKVLGSQPSKASPKKD